MRPELGEIDRSSTGFLPEAEHAAAARAFFERPDESARGWETAHHARARIVRAVEAILESEFFLANADSPNSVSTGRKADLETEFLRRTSVSNAHDIAIVAHGAVGVLLMQHLLGEPITYSRLQPGRDGGHYFSVDAATRTLRHDWVRIEPLLT